jgi:hypothetical protein
MRPKSAPASVNLGVPQHQRCRSFADDRAWLVIANACTPLPDLPVLLLRRSTCESWSGAPEGYGPFRRDRSMMAAARLLSRREAFP